MSDISQVRVKKAAKKDKAPAANAAPVALRNCSSVAVAYALLYCVSAVLAKLWMFRGGAGGIDSNRYAFDLGVILLAPFVTRHLLKLAEPSVLKRNSRLLMLVCVGMFDNLFSGLTSLVLASDFAGSAFGMADGLAESSAPFLLPHLFAPMLATLLMSPGAGRAVAVCVALTHVAFVPEDMILPSMLMVLIPACVKLDSVAKVRRRFQQLGVFALGALLQLIGILAHIMLKFADNTKPAELGLDLLASTALVLLSAALSFTAVILLLPVMEHLFGACSNIKLNNYADLEHPLLRALSNDAPGTYQHSTKVADLAFAAAGKIGANQLLCRVGAYFHDIGKIDNPKYFAENIGYGEQNPHDKIPPSMSASILEAHIKQGLAYADSHKFPPEIRGIIKEHHGTTIKEYFLFKAREQAKLKALENGGAGGPAEKVDESAFRYGSDKPRTKESAIIMLADSVEAATRSLANVTPQSIASFVEDITKKKINDGQFDECPLSFTEINAIKKSFIISLQHILHHRIAYPKDAAKTANANARDKDDDDDATQTFATRDATQTFATRDSAANASDPSKPPAKPAR
jgi:uncharacterized domain HDIG